MKKSIIIATSLSLLVSQPLKANDLTDMLEPYLNNIGTISDYYFIDQYVFHGVEEPYLVRRYGIRGMIITEQYPFELYGGKFEIISQYPEIYGINTQFYLDARKDGVNDNEFKLNAGWKEQ